MKAEILPLAPDEPAPISRAVAQILRRHLLSSAKVICITSEATFNGLAQDDRTQEIMSNVLRMTDYSIAYRFVLVADEMLASRYRNYNLIFVRDLEGLK